MGAGLVVLDLVVFFAVYRPLEDQLDREARRQTELRETIRNQQIRLELLKKYEAALPQVGKGLEDFTTNRTPPRRQAYSTAGHLIYKVADAAGVKVTSVGYRLESEHHDPLERLALDIGAQGSYAGLLKFAHALETANEFLLIREFTFSPGESGAISLRLGADFYVTP
jgi:Tfp pilus assembly protein PilO